MQSAITSVLISYLCWRSHIEFACVESDSKSLKRKVQVRRQDNAIQHFNNTKRNLRGMFRILKVTSDG